MTNRGMHKWYNDYKTGRWGNCNEDGLRSFGKSAQQRSLWEIREHWSLGHRELSDEIKDA